MPDSLQRGSLADYARFFDSRGLRTKYYRPRKSLFPEDDDGEDDDDDDDDVPESSGDCDEPEIDTNPISPSAAQRSAAAAGDVRERDASATAGVRDSVGSCAAEASEQNV
jgi:hypothetical protein